MNTPQTPGPVGAVRRPLADPGLHPTVAIPDVVADATRYGRQMLAVLSRQRDPQSDATTLGPDGTTFADQQLGKAVADVRWALHELDRLAEALSSRPPQAPTGVAALTGAGAPRSRRRSG